MSEYGLSVKNYVTITHLFREQMPGDFTSDDFRLFKLDTLLRGHKANRIGGFFRYLKVNGLAKPTGVRVPTAIPRGHKRYITVWRWVK